MVRQDDLRVVGRPRSFLGSSHARTRKGDHGHREHDERGTDDRTDTLSCRTVNHLAPLSPEDSGCLPLLHLPLLHDVVTLIDAVGDQPEWALPARRRALNEY